MNEHPPPTWLDDYVDGTLPPERMAEVDAHLAQCARCRAEVDALRLGIRRRSDPAQRSVTDATD